MKYETTLSFSDFLLTNLLRDFFQNDNFWWVLKRSHYQTEFKLPVADFLY